MLALSRKIGQGVVVELEGVELRVRVLSVEQGKVRLGFIAPHHVGILREELLSLPEKEVSNATATDSSCQSNVSDDGGRLGSDPLQSLTAGAGGQGTP